MVDLYKSVACYQLTFNDKGIITDVNDFLARDLGYTIIELEGIKFESLLNIGNRIFFQTHFYPLIKLKCDVNEIYITLTTKTGSLLPVLLNARLEVTSDGHSVHCIGIRIDQRVKFEQELRAQKKIAQEAEQSNAELISIKTQLESKQHQLDAKAAFLEHSNNDLQQLNQLISHDLQEPLRKVATLLDKYMAKRRHILEEEDLLELEKVRSINIQLRELLVVLQDYGDLMRNNANYESIQVEEFLKELTIKYTDTSNLKAIINCDCVAGEMEGNRKMLSILFRHLLDNAFKFYDPNKEMLIVNIKVIEVEEVFLKGISERYSYVPCIQFTIADNGIGFDVKYAAQMFSVFRRLVANSSYEGLGIGLALAKKIVDIHHGTIGASSELGKGSSFSIVLPLKQSHL